MPEIPRDREREKQEQKEQKELDEQLRFTEDKIRQVRRPRTHSNLCTCMHALTPCKHSLIHTHHEIETARETDKQKKK